LRKLDVMGSKSPDRLSILDARDFYVRRGEEVVGCCFGGENPEGGRHAGEARAKGV
jgi:hypothetical protein